MPIFLPHTVIIHEQDTSIYKLLLLEGVVNLFIWLRTLPQLFTVSRSWRVLKVIVRRSQPNRIICKRPKNETPWFHTRQGTGRIKSNRHFEQAQLCAERWAQLLLTYFRDAEVKTEAHCPPALMAMQNMSFGLLLPAGSLGGSNCKQCEPFLTEQHCLEIPYEAVDDAILDPCWLHVGVFFPSSVSHWIEEKVSVGRTIHEEEAGKTEADVGDLAFVMAPPFFSSLKFP